VSIMTRPRRLNGTFVPSSASESIPNAPPTSTRRTLVAEAPERGKQKDEPPESTRGRPAEAPDAGEGRQNCHEGDVTRGRSRS